MSSNNTQPSPPRAGSYVLVPSTSPLDESFDPAALADATPRTRLRFFWMLPLVAVLDAALAITLGVLILRQEARHIEPDPSLPLPDPALEDAAWERRKIVLAVLAFSFARCSAYLIVGISLRIRQLGVTVAAISILSTLFYVSVANLLFQARSKPSTLSDMLLSLSREWRWPDAFRHFEPTMPILVGAQIGFTLFEWVLYIAVVGVKIPPGGNPVTAKRWQRGLSNDEGYQRGVDAHSLYFSDGEEEREELGDGVSQANEDLEQARGSLASPISTQMREAEATEAEASDHPLLGASPHTPRGYGSTLETPRTPQAGGPIQPGASQHQGSVRSNRSVRTQGRNRSASTRSGMYSRSPNAAELVGQALVDDEDDDDGNDGEEEVGDEEDAEGSDPDDIIDITPNRVVARKEARLRLARAALPERRGSGGTLSTLSIFSPGSNNGDTSVRGVARGNNVFSDEAGSPLTRNQQQDRMPQTLLGVTTSSEMETGARQDMDTSMTSSSSMRTISSKASSMSKKFKLPRWLKPSKKK